MNSHESACRAASTGPDEWLPCTGRFGGGIKHESVGDQELLLTLPTQGIFYNLSTRDWEITELNDHGLS